MVLSSIHRHRFRSVLAMLVLTSSCLLAGAGSGDFATAAAAESRSAALKLLDHSPTSLEISFELGHFDISQVTIQDPQHPAGQIFHSPVIPGVHLPGEAGEPNLPRVARYIAVPRGAEVRVNVTGQQGHSRTGIEIAPSPEMTLDDQPYTYQKKVSVYEKDRFYPESPVSIARVGSMRGVETAILSVSPYQYNPVTKELIINTRLDLTVEFAGNSTEEPGDVTNLFADSRLRSRYWEPILAGQLLNYASLPEVNFSAPRRDGDYGFEHVIITNDNPDFIAWGTILRDWRRLQGLSCELFTSTDIGGHLATDTQDFLTNAYYNWDIPPVAFTMLGDYVEANNPDQGVTALFWNGFSVSDNLLADVEGDDYLPDMITGRIMAKSNSQLEILIGKMIDYESNPPIDPVFYDSPLLTGGWATDRWFILLAETIYGFQANELGKSPERVYTLYDGSPGSLWSTADNTQMVTDYFGPAGLGYLPATPDYLTDWSGSATEISARINAGSYFVLHRDHGTEMTWVSPQYQIFHINALTNYDNHYPFVFSINCLSGKYNWPDCFTEFFCTRDGYGALGGLASAEASFSFCNDTYLWGVFDCLWPQFDPAYPTPLPDVNPTGGTNLRTAFADAAGKYYMAASDWPNNPERKLYTQNLFHHFGDAFMQIYSEVPEALTVEHDESCLASDVSFTVSADAGSVIALTLDGEIVGVTDGNGSAIPIPFTQLISEGELRITVTLANHFRYDEVVPITAAALLVEADGSGDAPTIQAAIDLAPMGGTIELGNGVFSGEGNRDLVLEGKNLLIRSSGGDPTLCVIDCEGSAGEPHRGFLFDAGDSTDTVISNLTVRGGWADFGGAVYCDSAATPQIEGCVFDSCSAGDGGGLFCYKSSPGLVRNTFTRNNATGAGGALYMSEVSADTLCSGCTFAGNTAPAGGALYGAVCTGLIQHSLFAFNEGGDVIECAGASLELECCDIFGNQSGDWVGCTAGMFPGRDNLRTDPCFCDAAGSDYSLCADSPCLSLGCGQIGARPAGCAASQDVASPPLDETPDESIFSLFDCSPNPFTGFTRIDYMVPGNPGGSGSVEIDIFDISGRLVKSLINERVSSGNQSITWDGTDADGQRLTTGIYPCRIQVGRQQQIRQLVLLR